MLVKAIYAILQIPENLPTSMWRYKCHSYIGYFIIWVMTSMLSKTLSRSLFLTEAAITAETKLPQETVGQFY